MTKERFNELLKGYKYPQFMIDRLYDSVGEVISEDNEDAIIRTCNKLDSMVKKLLEGIEVMRKLGVPEAKIAEDFNKMMSEKESKSPFDFDNINPN